MSPSRFTSMTRSLALLALVLGGWAAASPAMAQDPQCTGTCTITIQVTYDFIPAAGDEDLKITRFKWEVKTDQTGKCQAKAEALGKDGRITFTFPGDGGGRRVCLVKIGDDDSFTRNAERCGGTAGFPNPSQSFEVSAAFLSIHIEGKYSLTCTPVGDCEPPAPDRTGQCVSSNQFPPVGASVPFEFEFGGGKITHNGDESQPDPLKDTKVVQWTFTVGCQGICEPTG